MTYTSGISPPLAHRLTNQLTVVLGFVELLLADMADGDRHRQDVLEIEKAARGALALLRDGAMNVRTDEPSNQG